MLTRTLLIVALAAMTVVSNPGNRAIADEPPIEPGVSRELARWRAARYSDVRYKLNLTLEKMSPVLKGTMEIRVKVSDGRPNGPVVSPGGFQIMDSMPTIVLDWRKIKGKEELSRISNISVNGKSVVLNPDHAALGVVVDTREQHEYFEFNEHLFFSDGVVIGENVINLDFTSPILTSGSAITRYVDKEDGAEYIYSLFVPSDASTAFPVFDQPDLKARFELGVSIAQSTGWNIVTNSHLRSVLSPYCLQPSPSIAPKVVQGAFFADKKDAQIDSKKVSTDLDLGSQHNEGCSAFYSFEETQPISTYVFAFAAGPFERMSEPPAVAGGLTRGGVASRDTQASLARKETDTPHQPPATAGGTDKTPPTDIYVRRSQAEKFKSHAAEVFRLNREAIKYFEEYFDYQFPFPKYDLVLIPEFPFGGMEHAGATFLRESSIIFPQEPTKNDHISRALLIFHEASHQWFGDTVTMRWFDDLWLKEGFATFTAYKAMERIMPEMMAWKVFYERVKQAAYRTDSTKGTTPIYQEIGNLSAAKSAYGAIVYSKAPAFLRQAEFYLGEDKFQTAVRAFLKKHEFGNAGWEDLVREFEKSRGEDLKAWASIWVTRKGLPIVELFDLATALPRTAARQRSSIEGDAEWRQKVQVLLITGSDERKTYDINLDPTLIRGNPPIYQGHTVVYTGPSRVADYPVAMLLNAQDYGYGIFLLDEKSREYVLKNIQNEKDPFLRSMMWGSLWDSVRAGELDPKTFVEVAIRNLPGEKDETITASVLGHIATAVNYYLDDEDHVSVAHPLERMIEGEMRGANSLGRRITFYRGFLNLGASMRAREIYKKILREKYWPKPLEIGRGLVGASTPAIPLKTKDKFDIVTRLLVLGDPEAPKLLAELEKTETGDEALRYAYAARAGIATAENKAKYWRDFTENKEISESWIEAAFGPFNSIRHAGLTLPYLERALKELPNHKRDRKIFFVNGWLGAFIGGQRSEEALAIVNKFLADNPSLDNDLRLKILENVDTIERAVRIRAKFGGS